MATVPTPTPAPENPDWKEQFKQKYKAPRDLLLDPKFHSIPDMEAKRQLWGIVDSDFNDYDPDSQNKALTKSIKEWQQYYAKIDDESKPKAKGIIQKVEDKILGLHPAELVPPPEPIAFKPKKSPQAVVFDPEGSGYDYEMANLAGLSPDKTGHWPSRDPQTGLLLKGKAHPTWGKTEQGEKEAGYEIISKDGRYYSFPKREPEPKAKEMFMAPSAPAPKGMVQPGTINLLTRPVVDNKDGTKSTVRSISFEQDGKEVLVPTVSDDGRIMSEGEAIDAYKKTGKSLGVFKDATSATDYASLLHRDYDSGKIPGYEIGSAKKELPAALPSPPGQTSMRAATPAEAEDALKNPLPYKPTTPAAERIISATAQGFNKGLTYGIAPVQIEPTTEERIAATVGEYAGMIPSFAFLQGVIAPILGQTTKLPVVGKWIKALDNYRKVRAAVQAGEKAAPASAEIAAKTMENLAKKYPEFQKTLDFVLKHPKLIDHVVAPTMQGVESGTVMAVAGTIQALANGQKPKDAILHSYSIAFLGEMMKAAPLIRALGGKFQINLTNPNMGKVITALGKGLPRQSAEYRAFREFLNQFSAAPKEFAIGRALQSAVSYGLAAGGITATMTEGDIKQRLVAGGEDGIRTFIAVGAMHLPSVIEAISSRVGRKVDAAEATIAYNNMTPQEKKELVSSITPEDVKTATGNVNGLSGSNVPSEAPAPEQYKPITPAKPIKGKKPIAPKPGVTPPPAAPASTEGLPPAPTETPTITPTEPIKGEKPKPETKLTKKKEDEYQKAQTEIDDLEDQLIAQYGQEAVMGAPIYPELYSTTGLSAPESPIPPDQLSKLQELYHKRDKIDKNEVEGFVQEVSAKFEPLISDPKEREAFVRKITQADTPTALRAENGPDAWKAVGNLANEVTHYISEKMGDRPETAFVITAELAGTPDNPKIQLRMQSEPGLGPSGETLVEAQQWMDHLYEGADVPQIPARPTPETAPAVAETPGALPAPPGEESQAEAMTPPPEPIAPTDSETVPEKPETILSQIETLGSDKRQVVFVPETTIQAWGEAGILEEFRNKASLNNDVDSVFIQGKGAYYYRPDKITPDDIYVAAEQGRDHELMGIIEPKSGGADLAVRAEKWNEETRTWEEFATAVVSRENLEEQIASFKSQNQGLEGKLRFITGPADQIAETTIAKRSGEPTPEPDAKTEESLTKPPLSESLPEKEPDFIDTLESVKLPERERLTYEGYVARGKALGIADEIAKQLIAGRTPSEIATQAMADQTQVRPVVLRQIAVAIKKLKGIADKAPGEKEPQSRTGAPSKPEVPKPAELPKTPPPIERNVSDRRTQALEAIRKRLGKRGEEVAEKTTKPGKEIAQAELLSDPEILDNLAIVGEEIYNSGITDPAQWHEELFRDMEEVAEGLGLDLEPTFPSTWEAVTGSRDYIGGSGGVYGTPDRVRPDSSGGQSGEGTNFPTSTEPGGGARGGEPALGSLPPVPAERPAEQGVSGPDQKSDIERARRGARYSLRGKPQIVLSPAQREEINELVAELVQHKQIGDPLSEEEKDLLRQYTGLGHMTEGGRGILFEDYTTYRLVSWMWDKIRAMGFPLDDILMCDPAFGIGNFSGFAPPSAKIIGTEINPIAAKAAQLLYPDAKIQNIPFEHLPPRRDVDLFITNVPFSESRDELRYSDEAKEYSEIKQLHDFFFMKSLDMARPNGMIAFITSVGTMDGTGQDKIKVRKEINKRGEFLGAYRTPVGEFQANTQYAGSTDIIFLRKRTPEEMENWTDSMYQDEFIKSLASADSPSGGKLSLYYANHPDKAWGVLKGGHGSQYKDVTGVQMFNAGQDAITKRWNYQPEKYDDARAKALEDDIKYVSQPTKASWAEDTSITERTVLGERPADMRVGTIVYYPDTKSYGFASKDGNIYEAFEIPGEGKIGERVHAGYEIMTLTDDLYRSLADNDNARAEQLREEIKPLLRAYQEAYQTPKTNPLGLPAKDATLWSYLNGGPKSRPFMFADPRVWRLAGLTDEEGNLSAIFKKNTIFVPTPEPRPYDGNDLEDCAKFIYEQAGELNWDKVGEIYKGSGAATDLIGHADFSIEAIDSEGKPSLQINDEYLVGDIWPKMDATIGMLDQVRDPNFRSEITAKMDVALGNQLAKLKEVMPEQAGTEEVISRSDPFSAYMPDSMVSDWLTNQFSGNIHGGKKEYDPVKGRFYWHLNMSDKDDVATTIEVTLPNGKSQKVELKAVEIQDYVNHKRPYKEVFTGRVDKDGNETTKMIPDEAKEAAFQKLSDEFRKWALANQDRFPDITATYNRHYRSFRERFYSDKQLSIPGLTTIFKGKDLVIKPHQWQTVGRFVNQGSGIIAHPVGAGKTLSAILLVAHLKNMNRATKPLLLVPAKVIKNWAFEINQALPNATIMDLSGMDASNRHKMLQRVSASDADFILMTYDAYKEIPLRKASDYIQEDYRMYEDRWKAALNANDRRAAKDIEKKLKKLSEKLAKMQDMKKTKTIWYEDLGLDAIIVDEGHNYKNAPRFYGDMSEYQREADWSDRAADLVYKTRYQHERRGGRKGQGVFMLTATPTPNSPSEIFSMLQYVAPEEWTSRGIMNAGDFLEQFGRLETIEIKESTGVPSTKTKVVGYKNMTELRAIYRRYVDHRLAASLDIKRPEADYFDIVLEPTEAVIESAGYIASLQEWWKSNPASAMAEKIIPITILKRAQKLAADPAILDPQQYKEGFGGPGSKLDAVIKNVLRLDTGENAQLIFCDLYRGGYKAADKPDGDEELAENGDISDDEREQSSVHFVEVVNIHKWLKQKLMESGIPENQIAIVNGQTNSTAQAKFKIQQQAAEGKIRFLIGTSQSMGEGMNLQVNTTAGHNIDVPWTPAGMEQRGGRFIRQGNKNDRVSVFRYLVKGTADAKLYDILAQKEKWNQELWVGTQDEVMDFEEDGKNYEALADATAIPESTLEYYREKRRIVEIQQAEAEDAPKLKKLQDRMERVKGDIDYRNEQITYYQGILDRGEGSDWHRRTLDSHVNHVQQLMTDMAATESDLQALQMHKASRDEQLAKTVEKITAYETAKKEGKTLEEYKAAHPDKGAAPGLELPGKIEPSLKEEEATKEEEYEEPEGDEGIAEKREKGLPAPPEEGMADKRYGWGKKKPRTVAPRAKEAESGPGYIMSVNVTPVDLKMLNEGYVPPTIVRRLAEDGVVTIDPIVKVEKIPRGWSVTVEGRDFLMYTYDRGTIDIYEKDLYGRIEAPELMNLAEELSGYMEKGTIQINSRLRSALGRFVYKGGEAKIEIRPDLFKQVNREQLNRVLGHEIGHWADWIPDQTLSRGNLLGRLMALRAFYRKTMAGIIFSNSELRKELIELSEYWDPYNIQTATKGFISYRRSPRELYADFLSVLLNSPGTARRMAPKFYREFHTHLDTKPEFKEAYKKIRMMMSGNTSEDYLDSRLNLTGGMIASSESVSRAVEEEQHEKRRRMWGGLKDLIFDIHWETEQRTNKALKAGINIPEAINPKYLYDELNFKRHNDRFLFMDDFQKVIEEQLLPAGITPEDIGFDKFKSVLVEEENGRTTQVGNPEAYNPYMPLGIYMFLHRSATQRSNVANPKVVGGEYAKETLDKLRERMGDVKFNALARTANAYTDLFWPLVEEAFTVGIYPERARESFVENKYNYFKFVPVQYIRQYVSPMVRGQIGFAGDIENPVMSDLKMRLSLIDLIAVQKAKQGTLKLLKQFGEVEKAVPIVKDDVIPTWEPREGKGVVEILEDGKSVGYYVDEYIAQSMNTLSPTQLSNNLDWFNHLHETWWKIIILYNLGFGGWGNPMRDFWSNYKKLPLKNTLLLGDLVQLFKAYGQAFPHVKHWLAGEGDDLIREMIKNYEWSTSIADAVSTENDSVHHLYKRAGLIKATGEIDNKQAVALYKSAMWFLRKLSYPSEFFELAGKVAGHIVRVDAGQSGKELAFQMRRNTSTPAWYRQGEWGRYQNRILPFTTMFIQGWVSEYGTATNPSTRTGYWMRMMKILSLKILASLLAAGGLEAFLGKDLSDWFKKMYRGITDYMETNYLNAIIGETKDGKPIYISLPLDEGTRVVSGIMTILLRGREIHDPDTFQKTVEFAASQLPSWSPFIHIPAAYIQWYGRHKNPVDQFRGRNILPQDVADQDRFTWEAFKRIGLYSLNQVGLGNYQTYDNTSKNWYQIATEYDPIFSKWAGRIVRIGGYGENERERKIAQIVKQEEKNINYEKHNAGQEVRHFYYLQRDVIDQARVVKNGIDKGKSGEELHAQYPLAILRGEFNAISKVLTKYEKDIITTRGTPELSSDQKDRIIDEIRARMDATVKGAIEDYNERIKSKSESLLAPPRSGIVQPPSP